MSLHVQQIGAAFNAYFASLFAKIVYFKISFGIAANKKSGTVQYSLKCVTIAEISGATNVRFLCP